MSPIKFEENIKDKLEKRTIEPSNGAWNKLSGKLDEHEGKSNSKIVWWLGIAASLVGIFFVTTLFFNKEEAETVKPILVETPIKDIIKQQEETPVANAIVESEESSLKQIIPLPKKLKTSVVNQGFVGSNVYKTSQNPKLENGAIARKIIDDDEIQNMKLINSNSIIKKENNQEVIAQIPELEKEKNFVTDAEIESLLDKAQKEIVLNGISSENTKTVDANSLLHDVETDLEQSFRDKVFNTIISSYNTVKTAVAERND